MKHLEEVLRGESIHDRLDGLCHRPSIGVIGVLAPPFVIQAALRLSAIVASDRHLPQHVARASKLN